MMFPFRYVQIPHHHSQKIPWPMDPTTKLHGSKLHQTTIESQFIYWLRRIIYNNVSLSQSVHI